MKERTKFIPAIVALFFTFVSSIVTIINKYEPTQALIIILSVLVGSYVVGLILRWIVLTYLIIEITKAEEEQQGEEGESEEGEDATEASEEKEEDK